jgi:hypothetical protein
MFATGDYERFYYDVIERYADIDIPITFGVLIVDYEQSAAREYIVNYLDIFNKSSGKYIDFFIPGYVPYNAGDWRKIPFKNKEGDDYYFKRDAFHQFITEFENRFNIEYPFNPMLVLVELTGRDFANSKRIVIELDSESRDVKKTGLLFNEIFKIAKKHTSIDDFEVGLAKTYLKGEWLDTFVRAIDNSIVTEVFTHRKNAKSFRIQNH